MERLARFPQVMSVSNLKAMFDLTDLTESEQFWLSWKLPVGAITGYLAVIYLLHRVMQKRDAFGLKHFKMAHNAFLCGLSVVMVVMTTLSLARLVFSDGESGYSVYCDPSLFTGSLWLWCNIFYYSKYYELLDTVLIVLCKKPLTFLHVYHHAVIIILCLLMMQQRIMFFYSGVIVNALVHSFMYYYYSVSSCGMEVSWKKHLTKGQMIQFVWGVTTFWPMFFVCSLHDDRSVFVWYFNQIVLFSFLFLFLQFFNRTYSDRPPPGAAAKDPKKSQ